MATTTRTAAKAHAPDSTKYFDADKVLAESLYVSATTQGGVIQGDEPSLRVAYVDDADSAGFVAEGAEIPVSDPALGEKIVQTRKIARLVKVSREMYYQDNTGSKMAESVKNDLIKKMDRALIEQAAPQAPEIAPSTGLIHTTGIVEGDEIGDNLDPLVDLLAELQSNDATPSVIVIDPLAYASLFKMKTATGSNQGLLSPATNGLTGTPLGLPVQVSNALPAHSGLVIDKAAVISAYSQVEINTSLEAEFKSDSVLVRATVRVGHVVVRPSRLGTFTVAA